MLLLLLAWLVPATAEAKSAEAAAATGTAEAFFKAYFSDAVYEQVVPTSATPSSLSDAWQTAPVVMRPGSEVARSAVCARLRADAPGRAVPRLGSTS